MLGSGSNIGLRAPVEVLELLTDEVNFERQKLSEKNRLWWLIKDQNNWNKSCIGGDDIGVSYRTFSVFVFSKI